MIFLQSILAARSIIITGLLVGGLATAGGLYLKAKLKEHFYKKDVLNNTIEFNCLTQKNLTPLKLEKCRRRK